MYLSRFWSKYFICSYKNNIETFYNISRGTEDWKNTFDVATGTEDTERARSLKLNAKQ